jgi:hypothetical protein
MDTVESLLDTLLRPACQSAPSWRVRLTFSDGSKWEDIYDPGAEWPSLLAENPPALFIARQTLKLSRFYWRAHGMETVRIEIEPPPGTIDAHGRILRGKIVAQRTEPE